MKKYKLLKDLPGVKAWTVIWIESEIKIPEIWFEVWPIIISILEWDVDEKWKKTLGNILREYLLDIDKLIEDWWLKEIKERPKSIYELKEWDKYRYIIFDNKDVAYNIISWYFWYEIYQDKLEVGNVFLTKEEAEKELEKRKALARIKKWIYENGIELADKDDKFVFTIMYSLTDKDLEICYWNVVSFDNILFKYKNDAQKCLEECREDWEILFDLDN